MLSLAPGEGAQARTLSIGAHSNTNERYFYFLAFFFLQKTKSFLDFSGLGKTGTNVGLFLKQSDAMGPLENQGIPVLTF